MPLIDPRPIVLDYRDRGRAIGAFNVIQLEHAEAIVMGAEAVGRPVILQLSENTVRFHQSLEPLGLAMLAIARSSTVPVAVHLDHAESSELVDEAVRLGFTSVMYDASKFGYAQNVSATRAVALACDRNGVAIEAELGEVGGKNGAHFHGARTDPIEAQRYVDATKVDSLAVAVGTSHAMTDRTAQIDAKLIRELRDRVDVPLVLHGSSGVDDTGLRLAAQCGMSKINIATRLNQIMAAVVRQHVVENPQLSDPRTYLTPARESIVHEVGELLTLLAP